jgi:hypothetical protein
VGCGRHTECWWDSLMRIRHSGWPGGLALRSVILQPDGAPPAGGTGGGLGFCHTCRQTATRRP